MMKIGIIGAGALGSLIAFYLSAHADIWLLSRRREQNLSVYWADAFTGGPDLLAPWYFAEIEHTDPRYDGKDPIQGPRQVLRLPAFR